MIRIYELQTNISIQIKHEVIVVLLKNNTFRTVCLYEAAADETE